MIRRLILALALCIATPIAAQDGFDPAPIVQADPSVDLDARADWDLVATRAEKLAETETASRFALRKIRSELVDWRNTHRDDQAINAGRLTTLAQQIEALGPVPESGEEPPRIAELRAKLEDEQTRLQNPQIVAKEAYARANGLIAEIDTLVRRGYTSGFSSRAASPLIPANWSEPLLTLMGSIGAIGAETVASVKAQYGRGQILPRLLGLLVVLIGAIMSVGPIRRWLASQARHLANQDDVLRRLLQFGVSLATILVPLLALFVLTIALDLTGFFGFLGQDVVYALPAAGGTILIAKWLSDQYFPVAADTDGVLGYDVETRQKGRRTVSVLAWVLAVWLVFEAVISGSTGDGVLILRFPALLAAGILQWRLGGTLRAPARSETSAMFTRGYLRSLIGKLAQAVGILGPIAGALGYGVGGWGVVYPAIMTLAVLGGLVAVQNVVYAVSGDQKTVTTEDGTAIVTTSLVPVIISFGLILVTLPVLALIWGVRVSELSEAWTHFTNGFTVGETRISPTTFASFLLIFGAGYAVTRFIKGTLRTTVMPRTKLDLGGQNAVVAGFGYLGILVSALVAFSVAGINLSSLAIVAGALSVGIGFGLQNIVSNFVSGIILLIERPIGEGDMIEVNGQMGFVRDISVRSTRIETFDRTDVIVPNADLVSGQVINWTRGNLVGRAILNIGVGYQSDTRKVEAILQEIANAHPMVLLNPPPAILLSGLGADSIDFEVRAILRDVNFVLSVKSDLLHEVIRRFAEEGIEIPFAQRDIWLRNPEVLQKGDT